jgi:hypothetical protein
VQLVSQHLNVLIVDAHALPPLDVLDAATVFSLMVMVHGIGNARRCRMTHNSYDGCHTPQRNLEATGRQGTGTSAVTATSHGVAEVRLVGEAAVAGGGTRQRGSGRSLLIAPASARSGHDQRIQRDMKR